LITGKAAVLDRTSQEEIDDFNKIMKEYEFLMGMCSDRPKKAVKASGKNLDAQMEIFKKNNPHFGTYIKAPTADKPLRTEDGFDLDVKAIIGKLNKGETL